MGEMERKHSLPSGTLSSPSQTPEDSGSRVRAKVPREEPAGLMLDWLEEAELEELEPLLRQIVPRGEAAAARLAELLRDPRARVREAAAKLSAQVHDPALLQPLNLLALDENRELRSMAVHVIRSYEPAPEYPRAMAQLRFVAADEGRVAEERRRAIAALSQLRNEASISLFIELLPEPDRAIAAAARVGLRVLTAHDFGFARASWLHWARKQGRSTRVEWLIEGLGDARAHLRALASRELAHLTGLQHALPGHAERSAFVAAQRGYQSWWASRAEPGD